MSVTHSRYAERGSWWDSFMLFLGARSPQRLRDSPAIPVNPMYLVDIHTHVSMKLNIWGKKFWKRHWPVPGDGLLSMLGVQVDFFQLTCKQVGVLIVPHDIPVGAMRRKFGMLSRVIRLLNRVADKMEHEDFSNFTQINKIINLFEDQVYITNRKLGCETFVIARSYAELEQARRRGKIVFIHAIEGSHALGRDLPPADQPRKIGKKHIPVRDAMTVSDPFQRYIDNLIALKHRGVCMMTLAYLFKNELSDCVEGIAEFPKVNTFKYQWKYNPTCADMNEGLTSLGVSIVNTMLDIGMIIDLTHSTAATRRSVYGLNNVWAEKHPSIGCRPVTFSHCGSQALFEVYQKKTGVTCYDHHKFYAASYEDIIEVEKSGGVIGIILENWWLTGVDPRLPEYQGWELSGIDCVMETIYSINEQTVSKDFSCISIGTDFDGFTDTPPDLYLYEQVEKLLERMRNERYHCYKTGRMVRRFSEEHIAKIFHGNAMKMLERGWK